MEAVAGGLKIVQGLVDGVDKPGTRLLDLITTVDSVLVQLGSELMGCISVHMTLEFLTSDSDDPSGIVRFDASSAEGIFEFTTKVIQDDFLALGVGEERGCGFDDVHSSLLGGCCLRLYTRFHLRCRPTIRPSLFFEPVGGWIGGWKGIVGGRYYRQIFFSD